MEPTALAHLLALISLSLLTDGSHAAD